MLLDEDVDVDAAETTETQTAFLQESDEAVTGKFSAAGLAANKVRVKQSFHCVPCLLDPHCAPQFFPFLVSL